MKDHLAILRRVGWVFVILGLIDIGFMVYCIVNKTSYSSSLNIFAIIAGVFLLKGSLKVARLISWFIALIIAASIGNLVSMPFIYPVDLLLTYIRLEPISCIIGVVSFLAIMVVAVWGYHEITSVPVRAAMDESGVNCTSFWWKPARGFWVGGCLALFLLIFLSLLMNGATATEVKKRAAVQLGEGYKFHIKSINMSSGSSGKHVQAVVTAYNSEKIKDVVVDWSE